MGVGTLLSEIFGSGNGYTKLIRINRAFFMQGLLLFSICRRLPDPTNAQQEEDLKIVLKTVMEALQQGAEKDAEKPEVKYQVVIQFKEAKEQLCNYIELHRIGALKPTRGGKHDQAFDGKLLSSQIAQAMKDDEDAAATLKKVNSKLTVKMQEIQKMPTMKISVQYWPQGLPKWDSKTRTFQKSETYYGHELFKVEKGTYIEMLLHRLLQLTHVEPGLFELSLVNKPELYGQLPVDEKWQPSLFPLSTVDKFERKYLNITMEVDLESMSCITINISSRTGKKLPPDWKNVWVVDDGQSIIVRRNDFSLCKLPSCSLTALSDVNLGLQQSLYRQRSIQMPQPHTVPPYNARPQWVNAAQEVAQGYDPRHTTPGFTPHLAGRGPMAPIAARGHTENPDRNVYDSLSKDDTRYMYPVEPTATAPEITRAATGAGQTLAQDTEAVNTSNLSDSVSGNLGAEKAAEKQIAEPQKMAEARKIAEAQKAVEKQKAIEKQKAEARKIAEAQKASEKREAEARKVEEAQKAAEEQKVVEAQKAEAQNVAAARRLAEAQKEEEVRRAKLLIPGSSSASHHISGEMNTVGREKKKQVKEGFLSRFTKWATGGS